MGGGGRGRIWLGGWVGVEIIRIKAILVQSIEIGLTGSELGKIKVKEIMTIHIILFSHSRKLQLQS